MSTSANTAGAKPVVKCVAELSRTCDSKTRFWALEDFSTAVRTFKMTREQIGADLVGKMLTKIAEDVTATLLDKEERHTAVGELVRGGRLWSSAKAFSAIDPTSDDAEIIFKKLISGGVPEHKARTAVNYLELSVCYPDSALLRRA
jgi:hypothetical protein